MTKRTITLLVVSLSLQLIWTPYAVRAQNTSTTSSTPSTTDARLLAPDPGDGEESHDPPTYIPSTPLEKAQVAYESLISRRGARGDITIENTLPYLGMSQCDLNLIRTGQVDERVLKALNYLVSPSGGGMTYLHVSFSKTCEQEVPDLIGGAYPVTFPDESRQPNIDANGATLPSGVPNDYKTPTQQEIKDETPQSSPEPSPEILAAESSDEIIPPLIAPQYTERPLEEPSFTPPQGKPFVIDFGSIPASDLNQTKRAQLKDDFYAFYNEVIGHYRYNDSDLKVVFGATTAQTERVCGKDAAACVRKIDRGDLQGKDGMVLDAYSNYGSNSQSKAVIAHELIHTFTPVDRRLDMGSNAGLKQYDAANHAYEEMITDYFATRYYANEDVGYPHLVELVPRILDILSAAGINNPEDMLLRAKTQDGLGIINDAVNKYLQKPFIKTFSTYIDADPSKMDSARAKNYLDIVLTKVRQANGLTLKPTTPSVATNASTTSFASHLTTTASKISSIIPEVKAASTVKASQVEPSDAQRVHDSGQAVDILAAGLVMCTSKSGGVAGIGAKISRQAPRPVKVAWQTDQGVSNVQAPFGQNFNSMAETAGLDDFLAGFSSQDGTFQTKALGGAFTMMGFNLLATELGIRPGSFNPQTDPLNYSTLGYALLADAMKLPDSSVFNPFISGMDGDPNPLVKGHDNAEILLKRSALRGIEKDLKLNAGSLDGDTFEQVMENAGKRRLEKDLGLMPGSFKGDITKPDQIMASTGQAKMDSFFRWPTGTSSTASGPHSTALDDLIYNASNALGVQGQPTLYVEQLIRGALHLPASANLTELSFKDSGFWKSPAGQKTHEALKNIDRQLFPGANGGQKPASIFDAGKVAIVDSVLSQNNDDLTFRLITGGISLKDYQNTIGVGAVLANYGAYSSAAKAFDFPPDPQLGYILNSDGSAQSVNHVTNMFLTNLLGGSKNHWVALGVDTISKALSQNPDQRFKTETQQTIAPNQQGAKVKGVVDAEKFSGMVYDAINGQFNKVHFSGANASLSTNLSPSEFLAVFASTLATDRSDKNAAKLAQNRFNTLVDLGKQQFGSMFDVAAKNSIGDQTSLQYLYQYDQTRPSSTPQTDSFTLEGNGQNTFTLSQPAIDLTKVTVTVESGDRDVKGTLSSNKRTLTIPQSDADEVSGGDTIHITYTVNANKAGQPQNLSPNTFASLINDPKSLESLALQIGAAKTSTALSLPPGALSLAAGLFDPKHNTGIPGIGQSALEMAAGLAPGSLSGKTLADIPENQINAMFRLESGWYAKLRAKDADFLQNDAPNLYTTDEFYKIDLGSTEQLLTSEITLAQYEKRMGNAQLRYNAGSVLANKFGVQVLGYRLTAQDFTDMIEGNFYDPLTRFGARSQEKNHGMPIGALAASVITGKNNVSLFALGTNFLAANFHLNSIDLSHANSLDDVKSAIGKSSVEQALRFKANTFTGDGALDTAESVGAQSFASAFGFVLPAFVTNQLNAVQFNYHADIAQADKDTIVINYLKAKIGPGIAAEASFDDQTLKRFEAVDRILNVDKGTTLSYMQYQINTATFVSKTSQKSIDSHVTSGIADILGIDPAYVLDSKTIISTLTDKNAGNDPKGFSALYDIVSKAGGLNFDASIGWDKGAFQHLLENANNPLELKKTFVAQGTKKIAGFLGINKGDLGDIELHLVKGSSKDMQIAFNELGSDFIASKINVPGYNPIDANFLLNGHFADGTLLAGAALMAKSDDMKKAGITYDELRLSIIGDPVKETDFVWTKVAEHLPGISKNQLMNDQEFAWMVDPAKNPSVEANKREFMNNARQAVSYKFMDTQVRELLPGIAVPVGFTQAMLGGSFTYLEGTNKITLTGDAARQRMGQLFVVNYLQSTSDVLKKIPSQYLVAVTDFIKDQDATKLQNSLKASDNAGFRAIGNQLDPVFSKIFGTQLAPGTSSALLAFASNGNFTQFQKDIWKSWQFKAFEFADHALGMKPGTASVMYQGIVGYQSALSAYNSAVNGAIGSLADAQALGDTKIIDAAINNAQKTTSSAARQLKTQTAMIIASVANIIFQKQFSQVETALGLAPGTLIYLIQYLIHPDPISLGLFIFFNFVWGGSSTSCGIDYYPRSKGGGTPGAVLALEASLGAEPAVDTDPSAISKLISVFDPITKTYTLRPAPQNGKPATTSNTSSADPITKALTPPKAFNGQSNDAYRKGIKAAAQYEVRRTLGTLLFMPNRTNQKDLTPIQIATFSNNDLLLFEKISIELYGSPASRGKKGPGTYDTLTDRIHLGY